MSEIWLVKKEWRIERRRETSLWFLTRCAETEGTVKSWRAKYLMEVSASRSTRR